MSRYAIQEIGKEFNTYAEAVDYCYSLKESEQIANDYANYDYLGYDLAIETIRYQDYLVRQILEIGSQNYG